MLIIIVLMLLMIMMIVVMMTLTILTILYLRPFAEYMRQAISSVSHIIDHNINTRCGWMKLFTCCKQSYINIVISGSLKQLLTRCSVVIFDSVSYVLTIFKTCLKLHEDPIWLMAANELTPIMLCKWTALCYSQVHFPHNLRPCDSTSIWHMCLASNDHH